jgi:hypothetical protein
MKRLHAVALVLAFFVLPAFAQRGGSYGGGSHGGGSHAGSFGGHAGGGFSAPRGGFSGVHSAPRGFSGGHPGFSAPRGPAFRSGFGNPRSGNFMRVNPPRLNGGFNPSRGFSPRPPAIHSPYQLRSPDARQLGRQSQFGSGRMPYPGRGVRPVGPAAPGFRRSDLNSVSNRMAYHSPREGGHRDGGWNRRDRDHDHDRWRDRHHNGFGFYGLYGWTGYPYWPWYGWGYPYLLNSWDYDDYDSQPAGNYAAAQYPEYMPGAYDQAPPDPSSPDQAAPQQPEDATPWPYSRPASSAAPPTPAGPLAAPAASAVTLVFKDGRPNQTIHNYLLTATTLSVLDKNRRDIPVDQIDVDATARLNREAGVDFSLPAAPGN